MNKYFPINDLDWKDITGLAVNNKKLSIYKENKEYNLSDLAFELIELRRLINEAIN